MATSESRNPSMLLVEERFAAGDDRFLPELLRVSDPAALARFTEKWKKDPRAWARRQILAYVDQPLAAAGHEPVVKRLFKHAEAQKDHVLVAAFMTAFDRLVRRRRRQRVTWEWPSGSPGRGRPAMTATTVLSSPPNRIPPVAKGGRAPAAAPLSRRKKKKPEPALFSYRTRFYLRRRAWRYFRRLGYQKPDEYVRSVSVALRHYRDADLVAGENLLDCWSLMQICFHHHPVLEFGATHIYVRDGRTLAELAPAPRFAELWRAEAAFDELLSLATTARSRVVRVWAMGVLRAEQAARLQELDPARLIPLLDHADGEVQQFAAEVFGTLRVLDKLELATWLSLLETPNPQALAAICDAMARHVTPSRLSLGQCVAMACAQATPAARLGFEWLQQRKLSTAEIKAELPRLAEARCAASGSQLAAWALERLGAPGAYARENVIGYFDSLLAEVRASALAWLKPESTGYADAALWANLLETPYDDVRQRLIAELEKRSRIPGTSPDDLTPVWCSVLLGVHRSGREKPRAVRQIAAALAEDAARFEQLGPLLALAIRSIRGPERRAGLAAVAMMVERQPALAAAVANLIPELRFASAGQAGAA